jgi:hypothetical protein
VVTHQEGERRLGQGAFLGYAFPCLNLEVLSGQRIESLAVQHLLPEVELVRSPDEERAVQMLPFWRWRVSEAPAFERNLMHSRPANFQNEGQFALKTFTARIILRVSLGALLPLVRAEGQAASGRGRASCVKPLGLP